MNEIEQQEPTVGDSNTPINPYVMREINVLHDRINAQRSTMEAIWNRMRPLDKFHEWVKETHPDLLEQYVSIRELEEVGKTDRSVAMEMMRSFGSAPIKAAGQAVKYEVGNGNL
jgi:hypothetical protein